MFVEFTAIELKCDGCGAVYDEANGIEHWYTARSKMDLEWEAKDAGWQRIDDKHYCDKCWEYDENNKIVPREVKNA